LKKKLHVILIPVFNDWKSLNRLIYEINKEFKKLNNFQNEILIVDDKSTKERNTLNKNLKNIKKISVIKLVKNSGSQKAIAIGLSYLRKYKKNFFITVMDSDGEDKPSEIIKMLVEAKKFKGFVITSNRKKREEAFLIRFLYKIHLVLTFIFTFKWISFGNFTSFHSQNLDNILKKNNSWLAHSSAVAKNCKIKRLFAKRGKRYFDKSNLNLINLIEHSLRVNAVFLERILVSSTIYFFVINLFLFTSLLKTLSVGALIIFLILSIFVKKKHSVVNIDLDRLIETSNFKNGK